MERQLDPALETDVFSRAFDVAPIGMALTAPDGSWLRVNRAYAQMLGYEVEELLRLSYAAITHPDDAAVGRDEYQRLLRGRLERFRVEKRYVHRDGRAVWADVSVSAVPGADGRARYTVAHVVDITERKQAAAAEARHRALIESLPLVTYIDRADDEISSIYVSPQIERILGYPPGRWTSDPEFFSKVVHPEDRARVYEGSWPQGPGPHAVEYRLVAADGRVVWIHDEYVLVPGEEGRPGYSQGFMLDITERKEAEEALRRRDAVLEAVAASAGALLSAPDWRAAVPGVLATLGAAAAVSRVYLFERHQLDGAEVVSQRFEWCTPGIESQIDRPQLQGVRTDMPGFGETCDALRAGRAVHGSAHDFSDAYGAELEAEGIRSLALVPLLVDGSWWGVVGFDECLAERTFTQTEVDALRAAAGIIAAAISRQAAEERARTAEERYREELRAANTMLRTLIDASPLAIVSVDRAGVVTMWSQGAERIYGWSAAEVLDAPPPFLAGARRNEHAEGAAEAYHVRKDGSRVPVVLYRSPLRDADGAERGTLLVSADISERKALEAQLVHSQRMEAVGRLAGGIAHDFNNLLTAIQGYADFIHEALDASSSLRRDAEEIVRAAERAASLVRQLLAFSRKQVLRPEVVNVNDVVREMETMLRRLIGEDVDLVTALDPALASVTADPAQLEQTVVNLAVNARDAMPDGGSLTLSTQNVYLDEERAGQLGVAAGRFVRLAVEDTGHGMDERTRNRAFEPFFTTKELGSGLGLATVFGIVTQSGGHVAIESEPGEGTIVALLLPATTARAQTAARIPDLAGPSRGAETVLLVEDEDVVRALAQRILRDAGYTVLEAGDGEEALRLAEEYDGAIDLVLSDVIMPGMNGRQLAERLLALRPRTPVVFMSGYTEDVVVERGVEGDGYLAKPFAAGELTSAVRDALDAASARSAF